MDFQKLASDYRVKNPKATFHTAMDYVKKAYPEDKESQKNFLLAFNRLQVQAGEFKKSVDRNWPEKKGY